MFKKWLIILCELRITIKTKKNFFFLGLWLKRFGLGEIKTLTICFKWD